MVSAGSGVWRRKCLPVLDTMKPIYRCIHIRFMIEWMFLLAGVIEFTLPVGLAIYLKRKFGVSWIIFFFSAILFILSLIRIPLNLFVNDALSRHFFGTSLLLVGSFFPSLTAGLFEEGFRFLGYRYLFSPSKRTWRNGLMYGTGHGGIEAILLVSLTHLFLFVFLRFAPGILPFGYTQEILALPAYMPLVATLERVLALSIQIGLSIIVLQCFVRKSLRYLGYAIGLHTAVDFVTLLLVQESIALAEAGVGAFAILSLYLIFKFREKSEGPE